MPGFESTGHLYNVEGYEHESDAILRTIISERFDIAKIESLLICFGRVYDKDQESYPN